MAKMVLASNKETKNKKGNVVGRFLQPYLLGLMARFTDVISDSQSINPPVMEQRRCIQALDEMIKLCQAYARIARPQVRGEVICCTFTNKDVDIRVSPLCSPTSTLARRGLQLLGDDVVQP